MLDIYQINPCLIGLLGQETLTDFELKNLSIEIEETSNNKLKEIKDFYLLELSVEWKKLPEEKKAQIFKLLQAEVDLKKYELKEFYFSSPRKGVQSPWATKTINIFESCGLTEVIKIEKLKAIKFSKELTNKSNLKKTQSCFYSYVI